MTTTPETCSIVRSERSRGLPAGEATPADRRRAAIRAFAAAHRITIGELARRAGCKNANAFYNFLNGRSSSLSTATLLRICDNFPGTTLDHLLGRGSQGRRKGPDRETIADTLAVADPEPSFAGSATRSGANPVLSSELDDLARLLAAFRASADIVERDLRRISQALAE